MTTIRKRLDRLEGKRPDPAPPLMLDLDPDLAQRIRAAQAAGTFPASLTDADLRAVMAAARSAEPAQAAVTEALRRKHRRMTDDR